MFWWNWAADQNSTVRFSSQICRLQRHLSAGEHQQDLFQSQPTMFVSQHSQPPTQSLVELIQLCGGTVSKTVRQAGICIGKYSGRRPDGSRILSEQWVLGTMFPFAMLFLNAQIICHVTNTFPFPPVFVIVVSDSITHLKQLSYDNYYLEWRLWNFASFAFEDEWY